MLVCCFVQCPYCGETIEIVVDCSAAEQSYIEDCQVCCCPITVNVTVPENHSPLIVVSHQDESF
ncbi:CPXCG motif-containing cysteine-rich protein [Psychromonas ossibalaenae]|uniref:CPXCG motif-containing cysteine-rich protein n=1 Tax=Psychromonas ossibalaenae TaxID=444922 RepID=UPI000372592F|nr:CPXCG motif-containing cysteine-rich protein [Psychromonas ossibalaenae]